MALPPDGIVVCLQPFQAHLVKGEGLDFLERLKWLLEGKELSIELKEDGMKRLVLRQNYGDKIASAFKMTRQGVRWRFQRLFNEIYVAAYETVYWIESLFGTELRLKAMEIARERVAFRKRAQKMGKSADYRLNLLSQKTVGTYFAFSQKERGYFLREVWLFDY